MQQLDLFSTGITCAHCNQDPGRDPNNSNLWNGFKDLDTGEHVCKPCGRVSIKQNCILLGIHYYEKKQKLFAGSNAMKFSEMPVMIK